MTVWACDQPMLHALRCLHCVPAPIELGITLLAGFPLSLFRLLHSGFHKGWRWGFLFFQFFDALLSDVQFFLRLTQFCQHVIQFFVEIAYLLFRHHGLSITERSNLNSIAKASSRRIL